MAEAFAKGIPRQGISWLISGNRDTIAEWEEGAGASRS
jgi:hypothetical protein